MKKMQTDPGVPPKKCPYSGYDDTITKILKRMTVTLNCGHGRWYSVYHDEASDTPKVVRLRINIKSFAVVLFCPKLFCQLEKSAP